MTPPEGPPGPARSPLALNLGLFFATLATLLLETLDARLLSVLTWYHLSFLAVSLAMLGMAAGAVYVFLDRERFSPERAPRALARLATAFAVAIPLSHVGNLSIPFLQVSSFSVMEVLSIAVSTVVLAVPFVLSGVVVTVALTRSGGAIGRLYAFDLLGAAAGCLLVVPLLERTNISSAVFVAGAAAAVSAACFHARARTGRVVHAGAFGGVLIAIALGNTGAYELVRVNYPKNRQLWLAEPDSYDRTAWNSHSYVIVKKPQVDPAFFWGPGRGAEKFQSKHAWLVIDGEAATPLTEWNGDVRALDWIPYDVTTLPYYLRHGDAAIIGVGGGRDILAAIWGRSTSVVGVDVNKVMLDVIARSHRSFAGIADRPEVTLVHDDGRAHLARTDRRFDVIQMSLVDTWAATGAGAFTLSENGLYTLEAWRTFLSRLKPGGIFSVSRWFDARNVSETSRLLALGVAALIDRHVADPSAHVILAVSSRVATLMVSATPFTDEDRAAIAQAAADKEFQILVSPWAASAGGIRLARIARSRNDAELTQATADPTYDYSPPTDRRPYYFNMLKPRAFSNLLDLPRGGALWGNLRATFTLMTLLGVAIVLVALIILWPLVKSGRPPMPTADFVTTMAYFATIGFAFMLIQIALLQRFAVYLGHPTYTLAVILFSMLLFTGLGASLSERLTVESRRIVFVPVLIGLGVLLISVVIPLVIGRTATLSLPARSGLVILFTGPLSILLGLCFPIGVRLIGGASAVVPWAWGVNGACGVLASIGAVAVSLWLGIDANLWAAGVLYLTLAVLLARMRDRMLPSPER
jgi:spermidine synthase